MSQLQPTNISLDLHHMIKSNHYYRFKEEHTYLIDLLKEHKQGQEQGQDQEQDQNQEQEDALEQLTKLKQRLDILSELVTEYSPTLKLTSPVVESKNVFMQDIDKQIYTQPWAKIPDHYKELLLTSYINQPENEKYRNHPKKVDNIKTIIKNKSKLKQYVNYDAKNNKIVELLGGLWD